MDLESFLKLEKRRLAEERKYLDAKAHEDYLFTPLANIAASMAPENKNTSQPSKDDFLSKKTKDWINKQYDNVAPTLKSQKTNNQIDDMEQWVSDTFYSYFPGFNNEYQKRQNELQKRQRVNEENLIKHQMLNKDTSRKNKVVTVSNIHSARSNNSSLTSNGAGRIDMEIINVNNPSYVPSRHSSNSLRPDSARNRLLQDLCHTSFAHDTPEDVMETSRRQAEMESARKKEYQKELMQQIEEKRRSIKLLRDKELQQEEALTRRLQEQLKTMKLEEQLEKQKIKAVKVCFDAERSRLNREKLLAKLEKDSELLSDVDINAVSSKKDSSQSSAINKENISDKTQNKVYKYFSNSEKYQYRYPNKLSSLPIEIDLELDEMEMAKIERECFHLSEKICPMCDEPLKELENFCLRCQNKLSFRLRSPSTGIPKKLFENQETKSTENYQPNRNDKNDLHDNASEQSFFLVCIRCECLYSWCKTCTKKTDLCKACQNKRNLCMTCRKTLCSFCLEEVACGKDSESLHINDRTVSFENNANAIDGSPKEIAFQFKTNKEYEKSENKNSNLSLSDEYSSMNNLDYINDPSHSKNMEQYSMFNPNKNNLFSTNENANLKLLSDGGLTTNSADKNIERLRRDTDNRLSRYLKNYGDLAYQSRGTQTTPTTTFRRDIVIQGEQSLSMPLLREMPKMTRVEAKQFKENSKDLEDLQRRWEIPAVQKYTISPLSPKVVTQIGAIRKQLQTERLFSDDKES